MAEPVQYMARTRDYYLAQGYERAYQWARNDTIPFVRPFRPVSEAHLALITTAMPVKESQLPKQVESGPAGEPPAAFFTADLAWDRGATHLDDLDSFFPIHHLQDAVAEGRLGAVAPRYHCVPTEYSQRRTIEQDAPTILARCLEDEVDIALLVPL